jgi:hypothetical protein
MPSEMVLAALRERCRFRGGLRPDYEGYCFANVPATAAAVLDADVGRSLPDGVLDGVGTEVRNVVVVLLDGLGYRRWRRDAADHRFLSRLDARGEVTPLTAVAPASTASAITTFHTGATPAEHGVLGWDVGLPEHGTVVQAFPHRVRPDVAGGDSAPPVAPDEVVRGDPIYPARADAGGEPRGVQPAMTLGPPYADTVFRGAEQVPYDDLAGGVATVRRVLERRSGATYTYLYLPQVDAVSHDRGADDRAYHGTLRAVTRTLATGLYDRLDADAAAETLLVVTSDHGFVNTVPGAAGCVDLRWVDGLRNALRRGPDGEPVPPYGDQRLAHLAVREGRTGALAERLRALDAGLQVFHRGTVQSAGLFGPDSDGRWGDLVLYHPEKKIIHEATAGVADYVGMHGGLTEREMLVPFAAARLSTLQREGSG